MKKQLRPIIFHSDARYKSLFTEIKDKIRSSRIQASLAVNKELISLYWHGILGNAL